MKYDDITLIKYVNNELEVHLVKELENEINNDEELKKRVKVFKFMTYEKLRHANQIIDLIDNNKVTLNQRILLIIHNVKAKYKALTAFISSIIAVLIWFSLPPLMVTRSVDFLESSSIWSSTLKLILSYKGFFWS
jgi:hypothetical protein